MGRSVQGPLLGILRLAHEIEKSWPTDQVTLRLTGLAPRLEELRQRIRQLEDAETDDLRRLAKWADHLHADVSLRHFFSVLVPFERLSQKSLRDHEFLVQESDRRKETSPRPTRPLIVVVENLRSAFNVGAVFRTAECFAVEQIVICGYTPDPGDLKTAKTAMGTGDDIPWVRRERIEDACEELTIKGYAIVALETAPNAVSLSNFSFPTKTALLLGNERFGLSTTALKRATSICRIPLRGRKNSLNVGIAFGIAAAEFDRQHGWTAQ